MNMSTHSAAVAYYAIFSLAPLLIIALGFAGLFIDSATVTQNVLHQFSSTFGASGADFIRSLLENNTDETTSILMTFVGITIVLVGAASIFSQLQAGLNKIFSYQPNKSHIGFWNITVRKILSIGIVLVVGILLLVSLAMTAFINFLAVHIINVVPQTKVILSGIEIAISLGLVSVFLSIMYKYLSSRKIGWRPALIAGFFTGILFFITKTILSIVLVSENAYSAFGGASALVLLIAWIFVMCQVFFVGAFISRVFLLPHIGE